VGKLWRNNQNMCQRRDVARVYVCGVCGDGAIAYMLQAIALILPKTLVETFRISNDCRDLATERIYEELGGK
jgi:uncharacterized protein (UPF0261 family)